MNSLAYCIQENPVWIAITESTHIKTKLFLKNIKYLYCMDKN